METDTLQVRAFSAEVSQLEVKREGVVEALIVPWDRPSRVLEPINGVLTDYQEQFARGALDRAMKEPSRVGLTFTHSDLMPDRMGYGRALRDSEDGAVMEWQLYDYARDQAEELLRTTHGGMSVTFRTIRPQYGTEKPGALVTRRAVHLASVAATDRPVYDETRVLTMRAEQEEQQAAAEAQRKQIRAQLDTILWLQGAGRDLSPAQAAYLERHRGLLAV